MTRDDIELRGGWGCGGTAVGPVRLLVPGECLDVEPRSIVVDHAADSVVRSTASSAPGGPSSGTSGHPG